MSGNAEGALKTAAHRLGLTTAEYVTRVNAGLKWCIGCKEWHPRTQFPRDRSRGDGLRARCLVAERGKPRTPRDPLHEKARNVVNRAVRAGDLPHPSTVPCTDCSHVGDDRRHEHDHHKGYAAEHRLDVEVVCTTCHADRERARRHG